jgi:hypothetical protein
MRLLLGILVFGAVAGSVPIRACTVIDYNLISTTIDASGGSGAPVNVTLYAYCFPRITGPLTIHGSVIDVPIDFLTGVVIECPGGPLNFALVLPPGTYTIRFILPPEWGICPQTRQFTVAQTASVPALSSATLGVLASVLAFFGLAGIRA